LSIDAPRSLPIGKDGRTIHLRKNAPACGGDILKLRYALIGAMLRLLLASGTLWDSCCEIRRVETLPDLSSCGEEARLLTELTECHRLSRASLSALTHPVQSVVYNGEPYRKLVEANRVAHMNHQAALVALRAFRTTKNNGFPLQAKPEELFPRKLAGEPSCGLMTQWYESEHGKNTAHYVGADGLLYEKIEGEGWYVVGRVHDSVVSVGKQNT
jgi:hypothetical protein